MNCAASAVLVLGYGSTLRGDDGAGPAAAEALAERRLEAVQCLALAQLTPELSQTIAEAALVVFIDASRELPPGRVRLEPARPAQPQAAATLHQMTPPGLLAMARELFGKAPPAVIVAIGADDFALRDSLSPPVGAAVPEAVDAVVDLIDRWRRTGGLEWSNTGG